MIDSHNKIKVYETTDHTVGGPVQHLEVNSHVLHNDRAVLVVVGQSYVVLRADIEAAVKNATNTARY